jgi:hypothetical protein
MVQGQPRQIVLKNLTSKITRAKWTKGVAQAVQCLLCKYEALSSKPHTKKKTKKQKKDKVSSSSPLDTLQNYKKS